MTDSNNSVSPTDCNPQALLFPELTSRPVVVDFQAGYVSSDGGGVLLARLDQREGYLGRFARCFTDHRDPDLVEHTLEQLLRQRVYALALGYEDLNDHDRLCTDPLLASLCGKKDPLGQDRARAKDKGKALGGKSTLNRLELTPGRRQCPLQKDRGQRRRGGRFFHQRICALPAARDGGGHAGPGCHR